MNGVISELERFVLMIILHRYERQRGFCFDRLLSRKIDALRFLIEEE